MPRPEVSPPDPADQGETTEAPEQPDTAEHPMRDELAERLEGGPPPRDDPPEGERADPHTPPLDRLDDYVNLRDDDPRRLDAIRRLATAREGDEPTEAG